MKKILYGALFGCIFVVVIFIIGANAKGAPVLTYVYSGSMEPLIKVNDAFLVWPGSVLKVGDIVTYRPAVLKAPYITHRITEVGEAGYITKGDNSPSSDQESGEPEVTRDRIIGKVVTVNGKPVVIPGLGKLVSGVRSGLGRYTGYLSVLFLFLGIVTAYFGMITPVRKRKPQRRLRLRNVYRLTVIAAIITTVITIYLGSRVMQVKYLVSEYPGNQGNQVKADEQDTLTVTVKNHGLVPVWNFMSGISPLSMKQTPGYIWPRSEETAVLGVLPQHKTGVYQGYVRIYRYPVLFPHLWISYLHTINPFLAISAESLAVGLYFTLFFRLLEHIHGFEGFIPLRAITDKLISRRLKRAGAILLGRRRAR